MIVELLGFWVNWENGGLMVHKVSKVHKVTQDQSEKLVFS